MDFFGIPFCSMFKDKTPARAAVVNHATYCKQFYQVFSVEADLAEGCGGSMERIKSLGSWRGSGVEGQTGQAQGHRAEELPAYFFFFYQASSNSGCLIGLSKK